MIFDVEAARSEEAEFSQFVLPATQIDTQGSKVTGLTVTGTGNNRKLLKDGKPVPTKSLAQTCQDFVAWLRKEVGESVVLVTHNCLSFDMRVLLNQYIFCDQLEELLKSVIARFPQCPPWQEIILTAISFCRHPQERLSST